MDRSPARPDTRYQILDWMRFLAAMIVFLGHLRGAIFVEYGQFDPTQKSIITSALFVMTRLGHEAVILFFVLSGFFVAGPNAIRLAEGRFSLQNYTSDRFSRIYIPYLPALLLTAACCYYLGQQVSYKSFVINLIALQGVFGEVFCNNSPLWSLSYEIWFYILIGSIGVVLNRTTSPLAHLVALFILILSAAIFTKLSSAYLMCWCFGGLAYCFVNRKVHWLVSLASILTTIVGCVLTQVSSSSKSIAFGSLTNYIPSHEVSELILAAGVSGSLPLIANIRLQSRFSELVDIVMKIGANMSYTLYLIHFPLITVILGLSHERYHSLNMTSLMLLVKVFVFTLATTFVMYLLFERNTAVVRRWIRSKLSTPGQDLYSPSDKSRNQ